MIKCNLAELMAKKKIRIADVIRDTGIPRGTLTRLYNETVIRVDLNDVDKLCHYFDCEISDLFEFHRKQE